ncbi:fasciclin domain-containing protein [Paraflavisolibacter sp. H34]|uniref:fasciclin domain-containing protein n=1 Tax=Huijunlia imazamoxiresistens TaxID=3127457 RepID=UPI0030164780
MLLLLLLGTLLANCRKKEWEAIYGRPEHLPSRMYQQLESKGNFKHLLAAIDKAGYKATLEAGGYWTLFAPHDSAFEAYFTARGIRGVDDLDSATCRQIITYNLVYNAFLKERLGDFQSNRGWEANTAFRRRTAYYTGVYATEDAGGNPIRAIASNRNNNGALYFVEADQNNKYIPYFVDNFLSAKNLSAADYNYFYPNTPYTGFNVADAAVTEPDIKAENGVVHVVNKVITPLPSIDEYLTSNPNYSLFKKLLDRYLVQYTPNPFVTRRYQSLTGSSEPVFTKVFSQSLGFSLNNENFLKTQDNDGQSNSYSIFVPDNASLQRFIDEVLLEHFSRLEDLPISIITDFINAHLWQSAAWPSKFESTLNFVNEEARFDPAADVVDPKMLSNGLFYGTRKVQDANVFSSVYGRPYLDPQYSMMTRLLNMELKGQVANIHRKYTLLLISDSVLNAAGYTVDRSVSNDINLQWRFTPPTGSTQPASVGADTRNRLLRILNLHVVPGTVLSSPSGEGSLMTYGGEYIGYKDGVLFAGGNVDGGNVAQVLPGASKTAKNGVVHYLDRILDFSDATVGAHIEKLGTPATSPYNYFWQYLKNSASLWNNTTKVITGVAGGTFYTVLIPSNEKIMAAVREGALPGNTATGVPNFTPTGALDRAKVENFILYHILDKRTVAADGGESGAFNTLLKNNNGEPLKVFVNNRTAGSLELTDNNNRKATIISAPSTYLSNRAVIHLIDNYLKN